MQSDSCSISVSSWSQPDFCCSSDHLKKPTSAFVKPPPCVYRSWCGFDLQNQREQEKIKESKETCFLLFEYGKHPRWRIEIPFSFLFLCPPCVQIVGSSKYPHTDQRISKHFQSVLSPPCSLSSLFFRLQWTRRPLVPTAFSPCTYAGGSRARPRCGAPNSTWWTWLDQIELARRAWMGSCSLRPSTSTSPFTSWSRYIHI